MQVQCYLYRHFHSLEDVSVQLDTSKRQQRVPDGKPVKPQFLVELIFGGKAQVRKLN
jgi:hypothetical protein